ncbi:haloacid dehalogenase [Metabacillus idriensis]|uniref:Haloacid dehalogenase n=1 Tax=Metabacillus idriensis TaxID=324768 RepID=A0A6I2M7D9_9BACI|nr:HAD family hydrolase [Metabacillus idriensis]MCM3597406.1 haloacid dehalogenase [Metabacillus idriensis]MRX54155.1 haloacid dehalogenase [Metabacillus idriensis]OHR63237.1 haloacid dehalogenase [Bacillus sp. HMSC76G11]
MIFASDLDQTLIYSRRSFREPVSESDIRLIEMLDGQEISFMTKKAISMLKEIAEQMTFVPVTTRTPSQYGRITVFQEEIIPGYAVTSNGGHVFKNGKLDEEWKQHLENLMKNECTSLEEVSRKFQEIAADDWVLKQKNAENLFLYNIIDRALIPEVRLQEFILWLDRHGWKHSLQGRKLYFVPKPINKWDAVAYVKEAIGAKTVITAGDSLLDLCMLEGADHAFSPLHGELGESNTRLVETIKRTNKNGIFASEEILENVLAKVSPAPAEL